jgi:hypothetical protein
VVLEATGTCKFHLAIELTLLFGGKVINSDKMQLYKACFSPSVSPHWILSSSLSLFFPLDLFLSIAEVVLHLDLCHMFWCLAR